jgi:ribonuclease Z
VTNPTGFNEILNTETIQIKTFPLKHRIDCTGFLLNKKKSKRKILADKLPVNFPATYYKMLQEGNHVEDEFSGITYINEEYTTEGCPEKRLAYCSDTIYDETIIDYIKDRMENYDIYKVGIEEWAKHLDTNYYRIEALKDNVFYLEQ